MKSQVLSVLLLLLLAVYTTAFSIKENTENSIPKSFNWGNVDGKNFLTYIRNQLAPRFCNSGWAFSVASSMSDRIKILRNSSGPDIIISPQVLVSCNQDNSQGCRGGSPSAANDYILKNGITDETCSPYRALDYSNGAECSELTKCMECWPSSGCRARGNAFIYTLEESGRVQGEENIQEEVFKRGPVSCVIASTEEFRNYQGGILNPTTNKSSVNHTVSVVGWGEDASAGQKYWILRNSQGSFWGENGFLRLVRGVNALNVEKDCAYGVPADTWTQGIRNTTAVTGEFKRVPSEWNINEVQVNVNSEMLKESWEVNAGKEASYEQYMDKLHKNSADEALKELGIEGIAKLPKNFTWGNVNGQNYLSQLRNQHNPNYCGGCWSFAVTSSLMDRIKISNLTNGPDVVLSNQMIINCHYGGSCNTGGVSLIVYDMFNVTSGISEDSCMPYTATDDLTPYCQPRKQCITCQLPSSPVKTLSKVRCPAQLALPFPKWKVSKFGHISGVFAMKAEIHKRGPISCTIDATDVFENTYTSGIYSEKLKIAIPNHFVSVIGWGEENGQEFWIARNSWGTYWGEGGFFRIQMHKDNLGIEEGCSWGVPYKAAD